MVIKGLVAGPLAVVLVTALPLVLVTAVLAVVALVSLLPAQKLRTHVCRLIGLLTAYAVVVREGHPPHGAAQMGRRH